MKTRRHAKILEIISSHSVETQEELQALLRQAGYRIGNIDSTIIAQKPKMAPHIQAMRENFAKALETDIGNISVKATRGEGMGFVGRMEGVLAQAVVLLEEA